MTSRLFTIEEANALLPDLIPLMEQLRQARQRIIKAAPAIGGVVSKATGSNSGSALASQVIADEMLIERVVNQIRSYGCELKDINSGLIDFRASHAGRVVYLCWQYGEQRVEWWHDVDAGFAGRQRWLD